jgi:hypothetical protein
MARSCVVTLSVFGSKVTPNAQMFASASNYESECMQSFKTMQYMFVPHHEQSGDVVGSVISFDVAY